jgi:hypothetical protein
VASLLIEEKVRFCRRAKDGCGEVLTPRPALRATLKERALQAGLWLKPSGRKNASPEERHFWGESILLSGLIGHYDQSDDVCQDAAADKQSCQNPYKADNGGIDVQVLGKTAAYACQLLIGLRSVELFVFHTFISFFSLVFSSSELYHGTEQ